VSQYESQFEKDLYQLRRDKLAQIAAIVRAANPAITDSEAKYPNTFAFTSTLARIRSAHRRPRSPPSNSPTHARRRCRPHHGHSRPRQGRLRALSSRKAQRLQIYVRKDDVGDAALRPL
jgi:lysyl-tRNA synthetase class 2